MRPRESAVTLPDIPEDPVEHLMQAMAEGGGKAFDIVPDLLAVVIKERRWEGRRDLHGNPFTSFEAFAAHPLWQGLECTIDDLKAFCRKREDVQRLILGEVEPEPEKKAGPGRGKTGDNVTCFNDRGNSSTYTLKRLKRDAPELFQRVIDGELSANAAAIEAGFRKKPTPFEQVCKLIPKLSDKERAQVREML